MHIRAVASLIAHVEGTVSFLFLGGACSDVCSLGCQLLLAVWLASAGHGTMVP